MPRQYCDSCLRPLKVCYCSALVNVANRIRVLIIQHPLEVKHPFNTGRMAHLCLTNSKLLVFEKIPDKILNEILITPSALLYPSLEWLPEPATTKLEFELNMDLESNLASYDERKSSNDKIQQLIVLDATWRKSKKILHLHPQLQQLPRMSLSGELKSNYLIRKTSIADRLSTIESIIKAMELLDPKLDFQVMLKPFKKMIQLQQLHQSGSC